MIDAIIRNDGKVDINSSLGLTAALVMAVVGPEVFIVQPGFVQGLVAYLGFSDQKAGFVASAEMFGIAATTILLTFAASRFNWRVVCATSLLVMAVANLLCVFTDNLALFTGLRVLAGLGAGGLVSLSFTIVGLTAKPDRNFGYLIMWVLTYGAIALYLMPTAYAFVGMDGVLIFFGVFPLAALAFVRYLPVSGEAAAQHEADSVNIGLRMKIFALFAMLSYFLAQGVVWAYLFLIGVRAGIGEQEVANALTLSQFAGIAGALLAAVVGARFGRALPLILGIAAGAVSLYFIVGEFSFLVFAATTFVYNFAWNMTHPFLMAAMASFDLRGRVVVYAVAMQMVGLAIGPALAAAVIGDGQFVKVNILGGALFVLSLALILPPVLTQARLAAGAMQGSRA